MRPLRSTTSSHPRLTRPWRRTASSSGSTSAPRAPSVGGRRRSRWTGPRSLSSFARRWRAAYPRSVTKQASRSPTRAGQTEVRHMRSLRVYSTLALLTGGAAGSCTIDRSPDSDPLISIEDGVEVATPPAIPAPFDPRYEWEFRALREIPAGGPGPGHDPLVFNPARALPLRNGTLLVHDPQADAPLVILDPTQRSALYRFGRNGQGPGELSPLVDLSENPDGSLRVLARANRQVLTYGPDGTYLGSERLEFEEYPFKSLPAPDTEGHFVEVGTRGPGAWVR